ncbi:hypothetical protein [Streptomyces sp. NPDC054888]
MKRFFGKVHMAEPQISDAERELFGGPLRYDMGWAQHEHAGLDLTMRSALRQMPGLISTTLRMAWSADHRALVSVAVSELGQGIAAAVGLLALNAVMNALLGAGDAVERLHALLPGLLAATGVAVVNSVLAGWSTSRAGRLEPVVERIATTQYLAAATSVELEAIDDPDFRRLIDVAQYGPASARQMIGACVSALNSTISLIATASVLTVLHPALLPMLLVIAAPRGWGAMRVAQERYVSRMSWIEHLRASVSSGTFSPSERLPRKCASTPSVPSSSTGTGAWPLARNRNRHAWHPARPSPNGSPPHCPGWRWPPPTAP